MVSWRESAHAVAIVFVAELAIEFEGSVFVEKSDGWMMHAVEHRGFYGCVVYHIFENDVLSHLQFVVECPAAQIVSAQAAVAAEPIKIGFVVLSRT